MIYRIDFDLNSRFGAVDRLIFHLVLNGLSDAVYIQRLLSLFSVEVTAGAVQKLVSEQLLAAELDSHTLSLSEPVLAFAEKCISSEFELDLPELLQEQMMEGKLLVKNIILKKNIINQLLPDVKLDFLADALDLYICERGSGE